MKTTVKENPSEIKEKEGTGRTTDMPNGRFPEKVTAEGVGGNASGGENHLNPLPESEVGSVANTVRSKMRIKPTSSATLDDSSSIGGVPLGGAGARVGVAGAPLSPIGSDLSMNPYTTGGGSTRPDSRYGKKIGLDNFLVNNAISEQIKTEFDEPKDLREAPNAIQGYSGRKQFNSARAKKSYGEAPGALLFERSLDFNFHSGLVATSGQMLNNIPASAGYGDKAKEKGIEKSNYVIKSFNFEIDSKGKIVKPSFSEDKIVVPATEVAKEQANFNWQLDTNNVTKTVLKLQTELGRETTDKWSPLGYIIDQPYETNMIFHDVEATDGAICYAAYHSAELGMSFVQNMLGKKGATKGKNIIFEQFARSYANFGQDTVNERSNSDIFSVEQFRKGSPAAMIQIFDSTKKYNTLADFLNQPRSLKMHFTNAANNLGVLRMKRQAAKVLDKFWMFSTDDGTYNPLLPVHVNDHIKLMTPYSLNAWLKDWNVDPATVKDAIPSLRTGVKQAIQYSYNDLRNNYVSKFSDFFVNGIMRWILRNEHKIVEVFAPSLPSGNDTIKVTCPVDFGIASGLNFFNFLVCSAMQDIIYCRNVIMKDVLFAGDMSQYIWDDLTSVSDIGINGFSQMHFTDIYNPIKLGSLSDVARLRVAFPELIGVGKLPYREDKATLDKKKETVGYYLPWYYNENQFRDDGLMDIDSAANMSFPVFRGGVLSDATSILYDNDERTIRLMLDRMVDTPVKVAVVDGENGSKVITGAIPVVDDWAFLSLRYDSNSDGRVVMYKKRPEDTFKPDKDALMEYTYLTTPRELGFMFNLPAVYMPEIYDNSTRLISKTNPTAYPKYAIGASSDILMCFKSMADKDNAIDRSVSLSQTYYCFFANPNYSQNNSKLSDLTGLLPSLQCIVGNISYSDSGKDTTLTVSVDNTSTFATALYEFRKQTPLPSNYKDKDTIAMPKLFTLSKMLWTLTQRYFSPINPFDYSFELENCDGTTLTKTPNNISDPLEYCFQYGFAGCLASDFTQDILDRLGTKDDLNMYYYEDVFLKASKIFA